MTSPLRLGRYSLFAQLASGGMATVYLGRLNGEVGFGRTVAIKRLHPHLAHEPEFVKMFLDEAHLAARVQHPNVAPTLDIVTSDDELFLVMQYIQGESLGALLRATTARNGTVPIPVVASIFIGLLNGLHAAHEARDEEGRPLGIIHRDVSPQNVLVGTDGVARLVDFGVARAATRLAITEAGKIKGKVPYMAPEQLTGEVSRQTDIFATGVVLWEALACRRLYHAETDLELMAQVLSARIKPPSRYNPTVTTGLDAVVMRALAVTPADRWQTAHAMAEAIDAALRPASAMQVSEWVYAVADETLQKKSALVALAETGSQPHDDFPAAVAADLPTLGATKEALSDPATSLPTLTSGVHTGSLSGFAPPFRPVRRFGLPAYAGLAAGLALVSAGLMAVCGPASSQPTARAPLASALRALPAPGTAPTAPASSAVATASPSALVTAPSIPPPGAAAPVATARTDAGGRPSGSLQKKSAKAGTLPSARRPPPTAAPADSETHDLLDTR